MAFNERDDLGSFLQGEGRLVYARYRDESRGEPYFLVDGAASEPGMRDFVREQLECLMPECADRRLHLVNRHSGRHQRRDGFRHYNGSGGHSPESLFHEQSKSLILQWLAETHAEVTAVAEGTTRDRSRRADVLATWPDGRQVAIEVQYSSLSIDDWLRRHHSYRDQGILDVWIFGNTHPHFKSVSMWGDPPRVRMTDLLMTCLTVGVPVFWLNPTERLIATPFREVKVDAGVWTVAVDGRRPGKVDAGVRIEPFDAQSRLNPTDGLLTPGLRDLLTTTAEFEEAMRAAFDRRKHEQGEQRERARIHAILESEERNEWEAELPPKRYLHVPKRRPVPGPSDPVWAEPWIKSPSKTRTRP